MDNTMILWTTIFLGILGLIVIAGVVWFGYILSMQSTSGRDIFAHPFWDEFFHHGIISEWSITNIYP